MNSIFKKLFLIAMVLITSLQCFSDNIVIMHEEGLFSKRFRVQVPTDANGEPPPVIVNRETKGDSRQIFFATGVAATNLAKRNPLETEAKFSNLLPVLNFDDLQFIVDGSGQRIAAAYPFQSNRQILITALHALQNSQFEKPEMNEKKLWGVEDSITGKLLDIVIVSEQKDKMLLKSDLLQLIDANDFLQLGTVEHLNVVDNGGELILSKSLLQIASTNANYVFFRNSAQAMIGYASSGAIIYNNKNNKAHSIITCASKIPLSKGENAVRNRALKLETIANNRLVELTPELINGFEKLPCDPQDGRGASGP